MIHHYITILQFPPPPILNIDARVHINIKRGVAYIVNMFTCTIEYSNFNTDQQISYSASSRACTHDAINIIKRQNHMNLAARFFLLIMLKRCLPIFGSCGLLTAADLVAELAAADDRPRSLPNAEPISRS